MSWTTPQSTTRLPLMPAAVGGLDAWRTKWPIAGAALGQCGRACCRAQPTVTSSCTAPLCCFLLRVGILDKEGGPLTSGSGSPGAYTPAWQKLALGFLSGRLPEARAMRGGCSAALAITARPHRGNCLLGGCCSLLTPARACIGSSVRSLAATGEPTSSSSLKVTSARAAARSCCWDATCRSSTWWHCSAWMASSC